MPSTQTTEVEAPAVFRPRRTKKSPATQMREMLAASRRYEIEFDRAWDSAWERIRWPHDTQHRLDWKDELEAQREIWCAAYERRGESSRALRAIATLFAGTEGEMQSAA